MIKVGDKTLLTHTISVLYFLTTNTGVIAVIRYMKHHQCSRKNDELQPLHNMF